MDLNEAVRVARICLHTTNPTIQQTRGVTEMMKYEAYEVLADYHGRIALLYGNVGANESVLSALHTITNE